MDHHQMTLIGLWDHNLGSYEKIPTTVTVTAARTVFIKRRGKSVVVLLVNTREKRVLGLPVCVVCRQAGCLKGRTIFTQWTGAVRAGCEWPLGRGWGETSLGRGGYVYWDTAGELGGADLQECISGNWLQLYAENNHLDRKTQEIDSLRNIPKQCLGFTGQGGE